MLVHRLGCTMVFQPEEKQWSPFDAHDEDDKEKVDERRPWNHLYEKTENRKKKGNKITHRREEKQNILRR